MDNKRETKLDKILTISGKPGLYKILSQVKNGVVVESLTDQKRFQTFSGEKVSSLAEISIFTQQGDKPLREVFRAIRLTTEGGPAPESKADNNTLTAFFSAAVPDYDPERVYVSHIRKILNWYNILLEKGLHDAFDEEPANDVAEPDALEKEENEKQPVG